MDNPEFHHANGWFFSRRDDGSVRIRVRNEQTAEVIHEIGAASWASIIAHVADGSDFTDALEFHGVPETPLTEYEEPDGSEDAAE